MLEHFFQCPYCWEEVSILLDPSIPKQSFVEDCEVCCNPMEITTHFENSDLVGFVVDSLGQ